jgi:spore coat protein JB
MERHMEHHMDRHMDMKMDKNGLLSKIFKVSFAINDCTLYLDTHPCDQEALCYINELIPVRCELLLKYSECFGPLTIDSVLPTKKWEWVSSPMPWEGGCK